MHIVVFRLHGQMNIQTQHIGPFAEWDDAYEYLCALPALGECPEGENTGVKYITELQAPDAFGMTLRELELATKAF